MQKTVLALRHVHFEDLGTFAETLADSGFRIEYADAVMEDFSRVSPLQPDLVVILGGPVGVYEDDAYPFLAAERTFVAARLAADRPTLGLCLGAQMIASAAGAAVYPGSSEIGFAPVDLTEAGRQGPLGHLTGVSVLHWHGDTFDLPAGAIHLAATEKTGHQAFAIGRNILALQFHPEVAGIAIEHWLVGHTAELHGKGIDPRLLRSEARQLGPNLRTHGRRMLEAWLDQISRR